MCVFFLNDVSKSRKKFLYSESLVLYLYKWVHILRSVTTNSISSSWVWYILSLYWTFLPAV